MDEIYCSVVFVGHGPYFNRAVFDERKLFSSIDMKSSQMMGAAGFFSYNRGQETFSVDYDIISLTQISNEVFHQRLTDAVQQVVGMIREHYRPPGNIISGVGLNMEVNILTEPSKTDAVNYCKKLVDVNVMSKILGREINLAFPTWIMEEEPWCFDISLQPDLSGKSPEMYLAVNVHQDFETDEQLNDLSSSIQHVKRRLEEIQSQVSLTIED